MIVARDYRKKERGCGGVQFVALGLASFALGIAVTNIVYGILFYRESLHKGEDTNDGSHNSSKC